MEKTPPMREKMDGKVFFPPESAFFVFKFIMIERLFPICTLTWRLNNYVPRKGKDTNWRNESTVIIVVLIYHYTNNIE